MESRDRQRWIDELNEAIRNLQHNIMDEAGKHQLGILKMARDAIACPDRTSFMGIRITDGRGRKERSPQKEL